MTSLLVAIPVLGRPQRAQPVATSIWDTVPHARVLFLCSPRDTDETNACLDTGANVQVVGWEPGAGDWARKLNLAVRESAEEWVLLGADDLLFHPGWFDAAMAVHAQTCACVIGTNDLGNPRTISGQHSTHPLVHRDYVGEGTIDDANKVLPDCYRHQFADDEFIQTASHRGVYAHARDARVEHLHPNWGKGDDDETYRRGQAGFDHDQRLFYERQPLWRGRSPHQRR